MREKRRPAAPPPAARDARKAAEELGSLGISSTASTLIMTQTDGPSVDPAKRGESREIGAAKKEQEAIGVLLNRYQEDLDTGQVNSQSLAKQVEALQSRISSQSKQLAGLQGDFDVKEASLAQTEQALTKEKITVEYAQRRIDGGERQEGDLKIVGSFDAASLNQRVHDCAQTRANLEQEKEALSSLESQLRSLQGECSLLASSVSSQIQIQQDAKERLEASRKAAQKEQEDAKVKVATTAKMWGEAVKGAQASQATQWKTQADTSMTVKAVSSELEKGLDIQRDLIKQLDAYIKTTGFTEEAKKKAELAKGLKDALTLSVRAGEAESIRIASVDPDSRSKLPIMRSLSNAAKAITSTQASFKGITPSGVLFKILQSASQKVSQLKSIEEKVNGVVQQVNEQAQAKAAVRPKMGGGGNY
jgi:hypothetical protein